ncbi:hypothetical protein [Anaeromicropila herbilytica]|uniref:Uncharacterized protein n=1 Tax=Anaeromicropila herbilytica TaxID=2785025 RepID=A0A7R7ID19_9FIRM|nr:hypothetical protein [Anaeromicropila herbilytica]BCN29573.1 hypothetical protein bsdtb5_08680 [Anaeromicropila herbilytica]
MSFLGNIGVLYMLFLIILLIIGFGMIAKGFLNYLLNVQSSNAGKSKGAVKTQNISWLKISIYSLFGIIISLVILSFVSPNGFGANIVPIKNSASLSGMSSQGTSTTYQLSGMNYTNKKVGTNTVTNNYQLQRQLTDMQDQMNQLQLMMQNMSNNQSSKASVKSKSN